MRRLTEDFEARERKSVNRSQCVERNNKGDIKMMKQMKRTVYEAPVTERFSVELEGVFCASADVENPNNAQNGTISAQKINEDFSSAADFSSQEWDTTLS